MKYTTSERVKFLLRGKVRISDNNDEIEDGAMPTSMFRQLIDQGESELEVDLMERYDLPFNTIDGQPFQKLPDATKNVLRMLAEHKATALILDYDFGSGSVIDASGYKKNLEERYASRVKALLERRDGGLGWVRAPLPGLKVAYNNQYDNGFIGPILVTSDGQGDFPSDRINDPSQSLYGFTPDPDDYG